MEHCRVTRPLAKWRLDIHVPAWASRHLEIHWAGALHSCVAQFQIQGIYFEHSAPWSCLVQAYRFRSLWHLMVRHLPCSIGNFVDKFVLFQRSWNFLSDNRGKSVAWRAPRIWVRANVHVKPTWYFPSKILARSLAGDCNKFSDSWKVIVLQGKFRSRISFVAEPFRYESI